MRSPTTTPPSPATFAARADRDLVMILLGDHEPAAAVSGEKAPVGRPGARDRQPAADPRSPAGARIPEWPDAGAPVARPHAHAAADPAGRVQLTIRKNRGDRKDRREKRFLLRSRRSRGFFLSSGRGAADRDRLVGGRSLHQQREEAFLHTLSDVLGIGGQHVGELRRVSLPPAPSACPPPRRRDRRPSPAPGCRCRTPGCCSPSGRRPLSPAPPRPDPRASASRWCGRRGWTATRRSPSRPGKS